jgi:hypothetical protein
MPSLRSLEGKKKYQEYLKNTPSSDVCILCEKKVIKEFKYWKITGNLFPYDLIAESHDMIMPIRHIVETELTDEEKEEFSYIKIHLLGEYDYIIESALKNKSIPEHFHQHLLVGKSSKTAN